jgi:hypothetical protein
VWVGVRPVTAAPELQWKLDGQPAVPDEIRAMRSARPEGLLNGSKPPRVFCGVYEFTGVQAGREYGVRVIAAGQPSRELRVKSLPAELPGEDEWFHILLVSCYHHARAKRGALAGAIADVKKARPPGLSLLLGDQVYLDLPTIRDFPTEAHKLAEKFEQDYATNWFDDPTADPDLPPEGYASALGAAPSISLSDDHEFWNNFPHPSPIIQNSWKEEDRLEWKRAAMALYESFQSWPANLGEEVEVRIPPLSIFVADTRIFRREDLSAAMHSVVMERLGQWVDRLNAQKLVGMFVTGQSIFDAAASWWGGRMADRTLANYRDFPRLVEHLSRATGPMICVTGDVHWGRLIEVRRTGREDVAMYELITSPASLVESVGQDQLRRARDWFDRDDDGPNDWPLHSAPDKDAVWRGSRPTHYQTALMHGQTGNQLAVLSLQKYGKGVRAKVTYVPVHEEVRRRAFSTSEPFELSKGVPKPF